MTCAPFSRRETASYIFFAACAFSIGLAVALSLLPFPLVFVLAYGLICFFLHYYLYKGAQQFLMVLLVLTTTILPLIGNANEDVNRTVALNILLMKAPSDVDTPLQI